MGAPAELIAQLAPPVEKDFRVFPENWPAIEMFMRLQTQWVIAGMGTVVGLNYQSVDFLFTIYEVKNKRELFEDIKHIELGALAVLKENAGKE